MIFNWRLGRASRARLAERHGPSGSGGRRTAGRTLRGSDRHSASEQRGGDRLRIDGQARGEVMVFQPMSILDISRGGAQIETTFALRAASLHDFRLSLGDRVIVVRGRICYCQIGELTDAAARYRSGVAFVDLTSHAGHVLDDFVGALARARAAGA